MPARTRLRRDLRCSIGDGAAFGVMVGMGETYLPAFVLAVGLGELTAGLIGSVPLFVGGILQIISPWAIRTLGSHKNWVVLCSVMQAMMFLPLIMAAVTGSLSAPAVLLIASLYWASGLAAGPAWNTWIGTLVPATIRPRFFATRTRVSQACVFAGFLSAGFVLQWASNNDFVLIAYAVLFGLSACFRLVSALMLAGQSEPIPIPSMMTRQPLRQVFVDVCQGPGGRLLMFLVAVQAAVQMSGPYFTPFMFNNLKLSYMEFMVLIAAAFLFRIFSLPAWGQLASRVGAHRLLWIGAIGIVPVSFGWVISQNFYWLLAIQAYSGAAWAAYELAFFLLFFETIPEEKRTGMLTVYNLINVGAWVTGSLFGGLILLTMQTSFTSYLLIFGLSALGRMLALGLLARVPSIDVESQGIGMRTIAVRPNGANLDAPVLPSMPDQIPDSVTAEAS